MEELLRKAEILTEALPYIKRYRGTTAVIKYGGSAMQDERLKELIATDVVLMKYVGLNVVIVHGGGPEISRYLSALGKETRFVDGLRVTDSETMDVVKMVLVGKINKELVSLINRHGKLAVGLSGEDGELILAAKRRHGVEELGFVGEIVEIRRKIIDDLIARDFMPVIASVGTGADGTSYNINADEVAGKMAAALGAAKLIFLTDVAGLYRNLGDEDSLISELTLEDCERMLAAGELGKGMGPKVAGCVSALKAGVKRAHILNGTIPHALLLEIFTDRGIGTMIMAQERPA